MAKATEADYNGTGYWGDSILTTANKIKSLFGEPRDGRYPSCEKVQYNWICETEAGDLFTIYDIKEYCKFSDDTLISFHIGAYNKVASLSAYLEVREMLKNLKS